jgi:hypothetical protein
MKEHLRKLAAGADNDLMRWCLARECLQARILESLQDKGVFLRCVVKFCRHLQGVSLGPAL